VTQVEIALNEVQDPALAVQVEHEIWDAVEDARDADEPLAITILDEGAHLEMELTLPGIRERYAMSRQPEPGEVRRAIERFLEAVGLLRQ
jgi:hypothetical protein